MFKYFRVIFELVFICITCKLQLPRRLQSPRRKHFKTSWLRVKMLPELLFSNHHSLFFLIICCWLKHTVERAVLRSFTWCTQRKSTLDLEHMDHTVMCHNVPPPGTTMHHSGSLCCQGCTQHLCQRRWNLFDPGDYNVHSSGTHDTPRSIHWDSRSVLVSLASNHVTRQSRRHKVRRGHGDFPQKG